MQFLWYHAETSLVHAKVRDFFLLLLSNGIINETCQLKSSRSNLNSNFPNNLGLRQTFFKFSRTTLIPVISRILSPPGLNRWLKFRNLLLTKLSLEQYSATQSHFHLLITVLFWLKYLMKSSIFLLSHLYLVTIVQCWYRFS